MNFWINPFKTRRFPVICSKKRSFSAWSASYSPNCVFLLISTQVLGFDCSDSRAGLNPTSSCGTRTRFWSCSWLSDSRAGLNTPHPQSSGSERNQRFHYFWDKLQTLRSVIWVHYHQAADPALIGRQRDDFIMGHANETADQRSKGQEVIDSIISSTPTQRLTLEAENSSATE